RAALMPRRLAADTPACPVDGKEWSPLTQLAGFREFAATPRDSHAHLLSGHGELTEEEAELHLAGKNGDAIARLISTLMGLRRRYADNTSMQQLIDNNIRDLKGMRASGTAGFAVGAGA